MTYLPIFQLDFYLFAFIAFILFVLIQIFYLFFIHVRMAYHSTSEKIASSSIPISVIIAARNESDNLYENLPTILSQDYPEFEVIVVNNQSIDDSGWLLTAFSRQFPNLRVVELGRNQHLRPGKKLPITLAIKAAKYEHFLLTDADCKPSSSQWIRQMSSHFSSSKHIVIGYGPYSKNKGFLNRLIRYDTAWIGVSYFSMALAKLPYMGVGRNLAYTKPVFNSVNGFKSHYGLPSGDDDLFIQEAAKKSNYTVNLDPTSYCYSAAAPTWGRWIRQKSRHYSTSSRYKLIKKWLLGIYPISLILMWASFVTLMFNGEYRSFSASIFIVTLILKWWVQGRCLSKLKEKSFIPYFLFWDLFYALIMPIIYYVTERQKLYRW
ncbi:MAG: glycosyltransferase [Bacteroidetes bacterium]|nr:glycosyltransferase [Bacteroidota bacterium]